MIVSYFEWLQNRQHYYWSREEVLRRLHEILERAKESVDYQKRNSASAAPRRADPRYPARCRAKQSRGLFP